jgi:Tol biopolymer transport system component
VTRVEQSPNGVGWSPDGAQIAFSMSVEDKVEWPIKMPKKPEGAKWTETPQIVERLNYRRDRQGFTDTGYRHIFVVPASGGTPRRLTDGNFDHGAAPEWTPDGKSILFSGLRENDAEYRWRGTEIYAIDVASGAVRQLIAPQGPGQQSGRVAGRKARRIRRLRLDERHVDRQQGLRDERGRVGSQPRFRRLGSVAAGHQMGCGWQRPLLHGAE